MQQIDRSLLALTGDLSDINWSQWRASLPPTSKIPGSFDGLALDEQTKPLRVVCCQTLIDHARLAFIQPETWNFATISHRWRQNEAWPVHIPSTNTTFDVTAVAFQSLLGLARLCDSRAIPYFWIDCLCIDQNSAAEKRREIINMGQYYRHSEITLIFLWGLDIIGPPAVAGRAPQWDTRSWTLQEEILSRERAYYVISLHQRHRCSGVCNLQCRGLCLAEPIELFVESHSGTPFAACGTMQTPNSHFAATRIHLLPHGSLTSCRNIYLSTELELPEDAEGHHMINKYLRGNWLFTPVLALQEMSHRQATLPEDQIYGLIGLFRALKLVDGERIPPDAIQYNVGRNYALRTLAASMPCSKLQLLTTIEAYHGGCATPLDGLGALPAFWQAPSRMMPTILYTNTLGSAQMLTTDDVEEQGLEVRTLCAQATLVDNEDHTVGISGVLADIKRSGFVDVTFVCCR